MQDSAMLGSATAAREPKATILIDRIKQMDIVVNRLQLLRDKIVEGNIPRPGNDKEASIDPAPTLAMVLNDGPEMLQGTFNVLTNLIDQIEQELF